MDMLLTKRLNSLFLDSFLFPNIIFTTVLHEYLHIFTF